MALDSEPSKENCKNIGALSKTTHVDIFYCRGKLERGERKEPDWILLAKI
jgi:hypothetical protein